MHRILLPLFLVLASTASAGEAPPPKTFKVMAYNVRNFLVMERSGPGKGERPKPDAEKEALYTVIQEEAPDILAIEEVGEEMYLREIQEALRDRGLDYPHREWIQGADKSRHVSLLSRFPIAARDSHTEGEFHLGDREMRPMRGFIEADIRIAPDYTVKVYVAHLKSKRESEHGVTSGDIRLEEAKLLRKYLNEDLRANKDANLVVLGDLNDTFDSPALKTILGDEEFPLHDLKPVDAKGYSGTYFYGPQKKYERIDYILVSDGLMREFKAGTAKVRDDKAARKASDHFPVQAVFEVGD